MNFLWGLGILVVLDALAIGTMLVVRRKAPAGSYFTDGDRAAGVFGVLATGFAIFAGFVIFLAFTSYDNSRSGSEAEALTVAQQYETAQFLPAAQRGRLTGELVCYGRSVVHQEWPHMEAGTSGNAINPWGFALFMTLKHVQPKTATEQAAFAKWLDQTSDRETARRDRIHGADGVIPTSLWVVLFLTGGVIFLFMLFFADSGEPARSQAMLVGSATTIVVVTLLAINALNHPYRPGFGGIRPTAMTHALRLIDEAHAAVKDEMSVPCDAAGVPTSS